MKIFARLLRSRTLTLVSGVLLLLVMIGHISWSVPWMKHESTSIGTNLLLGLIWMAFAGAAAFFLAISLGDLLFKKGWRGQFFHSVPLETPIDEIDLASLSKTMRFRSIQFSTLVLVLWGTILGVSNVFAGNFYQRYHAFHYYETIFRGDDQSMKIETVRDLCDLRVKGYGPHVPERSALVVALLENSDDLEIRKEAAFGLCKLARTVRPESKHQDWKQETRTYFQDKVGPLFRSALQDPKAPDWIKDAAWLFLGSIHDKEFASLVEQAQSSKNSKSADRLSMVVALSRRSGEDLIDPLLTETRSDRQPSVRVLAIFSLGELLESYTGPKSEADPVDPRILKTILVLSEMIKNEQGAILCASIQALGRAGDSGQADLLFDLIYETPQELECAKQNIAPLDERSEDIMSPRPLNFIILEAIARIAGGNKEVIDRLQTMTSEQERFGDVLIRQIENVVTRAQNASPR